MINLLLLLAALVCFGIATAWVAEHPGSATLYWLDYRIDTSFAFLLLLLALAAFSLAFLYGVLRRLVLAPSRFFEKRRLSHYRKGLQELTHSVAALAAADLGSAELHTRRAEKLLGSLPMTLLLSAQIARSRGDDARTRQLLEQMLDHDETEYLAARSLSEAASKQQLFPKALALAQRAESANPRGSLAVISLHLRLGQWAEALAAIDRAARKGQLSRADKRRYRGLVHLRQGVMALEHGHKEAALLAARYCLKELPGFVPAMVFAAHAFAKNDRQEKATQLLLQAWKESPHPQLAAAFRSVISGESRESQSKWLRRLTAIHPETPAPDSAWVCRQCGQAAKAWEAHCAACSSFDTMEWKQRELRFSA
ncbi:MAG: hypothetical protein KGJ06_05050 [Pseudomonadota bacterium]|nr:hypothetical protein [Pseudomonadota bacterium]